MHEKGVLFKHLKKLNQKSLTGKITKATVSKFTRKKSHFYDQFMGKFWIFVRKRGGLASGVLVSSDTNTKIGETFIGSPKMLNNYGAIKLLIFSDIAITIFDFSLLLFVQLSLLIFFGNMLLILFLIAHFSYFLRRERATTIVSDNYEHLQN